MDKKNENEEVINTNVEVENVQQVNKEIDEKKENNEDAIKIDENPEKDGIHSESIQENNNSLDKVITTNDDKKSNEQYFNNNGDTKMKDDPNLHPYNRNTEVKRTTSDDYGSIAMILGIIAIVCSISGYLSFVGVILGIIAIVKGSKVRKYSSSGMAGWVLGIISVVLGGAVTIIGITVFAHILWFAPLFYL